MTSVMVTTTTFYIYYKANKLLYHACSSKMMPTAASHVEGVHVNMPVTARVSRPPLNFPLTFAMLSAISAESRARRRQSATKQTPPHEALRRDMGDFKKTKGFEKSANIFSAGVVAAEYLRLASALT